MENRKQTCNLEEVNVRLKKFKWFDEENDINTRYNEPKEKEEMMRRRIEEK